MSGKDIHAVEVRRGLFLVFHRRGVPVEGALAAIRSRIVGQCELVAVQVTGEAIARIDAALTRSDGPEPDLDRGAEAN